MFTVNRNPSVGDLRKFGWAMLFGFGVIGGLLLFLKAPGSFGRTVGVGVASLGVVLFVVSMAAPTMAKPIYVVWMTVGVGIGTVMSTILLTVLFVILLPFFSLLIRLGDPLRKKLGAASYWEDYKHYEPTMERMRRPF